MPNLVPVTVNDGTTDHLFKPARLDGNSAILAATISGTDSFHQLSITAPSQGRDGMQKPSIRFVVPVIRTVNGEEVRTSRVLATLNVEAPRVAPAERAQALKLMRNAIDAELVKAVLEAGEGLW